MKTITNKIFNNINLLFSYCFIGLICGFTYFSIEILWRGYSHYSMFILAMVIGLFICIQNDYILFHGMYYELQVLYCTVIATIGELITGLIFNQDYTIWDYRELWGTFAYGQLNIRFIFAWMIICMFAIPFLDYLEWKFCFGKKPNYRFLINKFKSNKRNLKEI